MHQQRIAANEEALPLQAEAPLHERLQIGPLAALVIVRLFDAGHYLRHSKWLDGIGDLNVDDSAALFEHYISEGIHRNASPSPYVNIDYLQEELSEYQDRAVSRDEPIVSLWLRHGFKSIKGVPWFDEQFYLAKHTDLAGKVDNAFLHFATNGLRERRMPTSYMQDLVNHSVAFFPNDAVDITLLLSRIPTEFQAAFATGAYGQELQSLFMESVYLAQRGIKESIPMHACLANFLVGGASEHIRPSVLFNVEHYTTKVAQYLEGIDDATQIPAAARRYHGLKVSHKVARPVLPNEIAKKFQDKPTDIEMSPLGELSPYLHWFFIGREFNIFSTPLFDEEQYCLSHGDAVTAWDAYPFEHYLHHGRSDPARRISAYFDADYYHFRVKEFTEKWPLIDYVLHGQFAGYAPAPDFDCSKIETPNPLLSSAAEQTSLHILKQVARLNTGVLADMLARAEILDPTVATPLTSRRLLQAPIRHAETELNGAMKNLIGDLSKTQYDSIVLVPQVRMAGSAKIAGKFTQVLATLTGDKNVLLVLTDQVTFERPDWFPENVDVLPLFDYVSDEPMERKVAALFDTVRGLQPKRLININSNVGWHMTSLFGRQLSAWMDLYIYLFCSDINEAGKKQGYPIEWFLPTFDYCKGVFCDSDNLREELWDRYCHTASQKSKITTLHTPAEDRDVNYAAALQHRIGHEGVRRVFWSGRFDRQKRIDILLSVVKAMPEVEFWVWGKPVLNDESIDFSEPPANMKLMGAYSSIDDVPIASCDCFLYTAGWDGLPTVLIEVGSRCVPVVASAVGGVVDLITDESGWPIHNANNIDDYVMSIQAVLDDYETALMKASVLREHTLALCNIENYTSTLASQLSLECSGGDLS